MSVLPIPSFLDDVKEKGIRKATLELIDESVERLTAGLNIQDIREALRGEAPSRRPNPRLTPHADAFWMHMRPSYYHQAVTGIYPTFRLGWLSTYFFVIEIITGLFLMIFYTPSPEAAYPNMLNILSNVPLGQFMRDLHRLGAEGMVLAVALHTIRTFTTGSFKKPRQFTWFSGMVLMLTTLFLSFSGYLLPWDQLAFWAVTIGTSMAEAAPPEIVGTNVNLLLRGAPDIGAGGLLRFYLLHVFLLPMLTAIFLGVHYYKVVLHGASLPPQMEEVGTDTAKRIPMDKRVYFTPDILTNELTWFGITSFIMVVLVIWFFHAPLEHHANPQVTPLHTTAPWYFLWLQGLLKLGDKIFWGLVFPTVLLGLFFVWPYLDVAPSRRYSHRRFGLSLMLLFITFMLVLTYMGTPKYGVETSGDQEVAQALAPVEGVGPLRALPYDAWTNGTYCTDDLTKDHQLNPDLIEWLGAQAPVPLLPDTTRSVMCQAVPEGPLMGLMEDYKHLMETHDEKLPNAVGILHVTDDQKTTNSQRDLKRIDIKIVWNVPLTDVNHNLQYDTDAQGNKVPKLQMVERAVDENGTLKQAPAILSSGKQVYINRLSEYQGGGH
ncbi:MAG: cytochrome bc complex cytochrome b subunit [Anaerolineae bacterium]|nr:cytochrome bc complex cytochrome b subunit [Anaerolineae bacterium]